MHHGIFIKGKRCDFLFQSKASMLACKVSNISINKSGSKQIVTMLSSEQMYKTSGTRKRKKTDPG